MSAEENLLPCPFCGSDAYGEYIGDDGMYRVRCKSLACQAEMEDWKDFAIEQWNQRVNTVDKPTEPHADGDYSYMCGNEFCRCCS